MKNKTADFYEEDLSIGDGWGNLTDKMVTEKEGWTSGEVAAKQGYVLVYSQNSPDMTTLRFVYNGRLYSRSWKHTFGHRTLVTLAKKFAAEIAE